MFEKESEDSPKCSFWCPSRPLYSYGGGTNPCLQFWEDERFGKNYTTFSMDPYLGIRRYVLRPLSEPGYYNITIFRLSEPGLFYRDTFRFEVTVLPLPSG